MKNDNNLINLAEKHILPILDEKFQDFDPHNISTINYEVQKEFEEKAKQIDSPKQIEQFIETLKIQFEQLDLEKSEKELLERVKSEREDLATKDYRAELLYQLVEEADKVAPLISFFIINRLEYHELGIRTIKCIAVLNECKEYKGERRAERVADFYHETAERLYDNYVRILWELCCVIQGKKRLNSKGSFGTVINNLKRHLPEKYQPLLNPDVRWYRNATAHKSREYSPENDIITLWAKEGQDYVYDDICVNCLFDMGQDNCWIAGNILSKVSAMYIQKNYIIDSGFFEMSLSMIKELDLSNSEEDVKYEIQFKKLFSKIKEYEFIRF